MSQKSSAMPAARSWQSALARARLQAGAALADGFFRGISLVGRAHPAARPERHGLERIRDIPYRDTGHPEHRLDVYRPAAQGPLRPCVLYVHGGGFRVLSKDTHWLMGLAFARRGAVVFNTSYRLAPRDPYPAAVEDVCAAYAWVVRHAARFGADPGKLVLAGESAGANLVAALALAACYERPEPFARVVWDTAVTPRAVLAACGLFQTSDTERFRRRRKLPWWVADRIEEVTLAYLDRDDYAPGELDLADPVVVLERGVAPARPLPPFFLPVGTRDPLLDDTRRLQAALRALGVRCEARFYPGEIHAFHALLWRRNARRCWQDSYAFLDEALGR